MTSLTIFVLVSAIILFTSFRRVPGIGVIAALVIISLTLWLSGDDLIGLGFFPPENWTITIGWSVLLGIVIQLVSTFILEPLSDKVTKGSTDHSSFDNLRGNLLNFILILAGVWVVVVFLEEVIFRGYMMGVVAELLGTSKVALTFNVLLTSVVFGLAHWYQGRSGALSTGIIGAILGALFVVNGFNLWLPILTHGVIDTVGLFLIYVNADKFLKERVNLFR